MKDTELALVLLGTSVLAGQFSKGVQKYFAAEYPDKVAFGVFNRSEVPTPRWLLERVGDVLPKAGTPVEEAPAGYYLFRNGRAIAYHSGTTPSSANGSGFLETLLTVASNMADTKVARIVIDHFEDVLKNRGSRTATANRV